MSKAAVIDFIKYLEKRSEEEPNLILDKGGVITKQYRVPYAFLNDLESHIVAANLGVTREEYTELIEKGFKFSKEHLYLPCVQDDCLQHAKLCHDGLFFKSSNSNL